MNDDICIHAVLVADVFVTVLETKEKFVLVSLLFFKPYEVRYIANWVDSYVVSYNEKDSNGYYVKNALKIEQAIIYNGNAIAVVARGKNKIYYDNNKLREFYTPQEQYKEMINTADAKKLIC
ncbi:hypothetical protein [Bacillus sp. FJAT-44742]|uniref:hypothetical protein n=1 Tax=Bacillus sp. FJAT-44742 TaxID=2014005 RepID=UPI000C232479|nr:hypothetical protein [Bacillus sp. FJAT-44742]